MATYDSVYIDEHLGDFYDFEDAVIAHPRGAFLDRDTIAVLYLSMRRES